MRLCFECSCRSEKQEKNLAARVKGVEGVTYPPRTEYFGDPAFRDLKIEAGGRSFDVTKYQLAMKSKVFAKMLMTDMKEKNEGVVRLDDDAETVEAMLNYISSYKKVKGNKLARKVVKLAHHYEIDDLKDQCEIELLETATMENAKANIMLAGELKLPLLFSTCNELLYFNFESPDSGVPVLSFSPTEMLFRLCKSASTHKLVNHSEMTIAFNIYSCDPLRTCMEFKVIEPLSELQLRAGDIVYSGISPIGLVYYAPYVSDRYIDYNGLHLMPEARFLRINFGQPKTTGARGRSCRLCQAKTDMRLHIDNIGRKLKLNGETRNDFFNHPGISDFQIQAGDKIFYVTKYQLVSKSEIFAQRIIEKKENSITLGEDPEVVEAMLKFIYMNQKVKGNELARKVVQLAHRFKIKDLMEQCAFEIMETLEKEDVVDVLLEILPLDLPFVAYKCHEMVYRNFSDFDPPPITFIPAAIEFCEGHDFYPVTDLVFSNQSDVEMVVQVYASKPWVVELMGPQIIGPLAEINAEGLSYENFYEQTGLLYFAPHDPSSDCQKLHLLPNARFVPVELARCNPKSCKFCGVQGDN
ncbi:unnamed protein product [Bursaphelenchus xylophilus]|uniref:(pine wood nematode) hypothetical protein n=1 Tax=Bursaphelenchus xylophilus TaxID=6326 RepID=A0A1I7S617_BURXY|nr:unnamed protein product [Bursaphelenchus xylophilus]CAG9082386.1 unnamed protein product [Bursaphelenchus xylophilus]